MIRPRVLVVDDESDIRIIVRRLLLDNGFDVFEVADGREARTAATRSKADIIIMDLIMPGMSGAAAIKELQADPFCSTIPIVIITGSPLLRPQTTPAQLGALRLLTKPLNLDQLLATVTALIQRN